MINPAILNKYIASLNTLDPFSLHDARIKVFRQSFKKIEVTMRSFKEPYVINAYIDDQSLIENSPKALAVFIEQILKTLKCKLTDVYLGALRRDHIRSGYELQALTYGSTKTLFIFND